MLHPRLRRTSLCLLVITAIASLFVIFRGFSEPELEPEIEEPRNQQQEQQPQVTSPAAPERPQSPEPKLYPVLGKHKYRQDGLLKVNLEGAHPIYELISRAETEWNEKLQRASKTFEQAVEEYERRYKRAPPKGFDSW